MNETERVHIQGAPGFEDFYAWLYVTYGGGDDRGMLCMVIDDEDGIFVVPAKHVTYVTP